MMALTNLAKSFLLILTVFQLSTFVSARAFKVSRAPVDESSLLTNAARFQAGLGPMKPRSFVNPSRVGARTPTTSSLPVTGNIEVRNAGGLIMGYISKTLGPKGYGMASDNADKMSITFTRNSPFNVAINGGALPYLGFDGGNLVSPVDSNKNWLVGTNPTGPGSKPKNVGASYTGKSESSIWFFSALTHQLTVQWINSDGSSPTSRFWFYPGKHALGLVETNPPNSNAGQEVFLFLV